MVSDIETGHKHLKNPYFIDLPILLTDLDEIFNFQTEHLTLNMPEQFSAILFYTLLPLIILSV